MHGMAGNVSEWCRDRFGRYVYYAACDGDGLRDGPSRAARIIRGGNYYKPARYARSAHRRSFHADHPENTLGLRVARAIEK